MPAIGPVTILDSVFPVLFSPLPQSSRVRSDFLRPLSISDGSAAIFTKSVAMLAMPLRSEEHTSELQSRPHLVCRLLLEKKKKTLKYSDDHVLASRAHIPARTAVDHRRDELHHQPCHIRSHSNRRLSSVIEPRSSTLVRH